MRLSKSNQTIQGKAEVFKMKAIMFKVEGEKKMLSKLSRQDYEPQHDTESKHGEPGMEPK